MQVGLHQFHADTISWLCTAVSKEGHTRASLARGLCVRENWTGERGEYCLASARKALPVLADRLGLALPPPRAAFGRGRGTGRPPEAWPDRSLRCRLAALGTVTLEAVEGDGERRSWEAMMATHHPHGWARAPGGQVRYWVRSARHGRLGGIGFCAASWHQKARDDFIGWSPDARAANLSRLINNHRFLLLPGVRVHGLASRVLNLAVARVADDWEAAYNVRPAMAYSYIGPEHAGGCYAAAGWQCCAQRTSGQPPGAAAGPARTVWMKPLTVEWDTILRAEPARGIRAAPALHMDERTDWAGWEYARGSHPDGRVRDRIARMGRAWLERPGAAIPALFPARPERKAAYRLLSSGRVSMDHILEPHQATMVERCQVEKVVLALQDTTTLNYTGLKATGGLVDLGGKETRGLLAHVGLAVTATGRPLGVFALDATFRDGDDKETESVRWQRGYERARDLARACPETRVVTVCDREGDIWTLLCEAASQDAALLVRARRSARRRVVLETDAKTDLWAHVAALPRLAGKTVKVAARGGGKRARSGRTAKLDLRAARVKLAPPRKAGKTKSRTPVDVLAVSATEPNPPAGQAPLHWLLLCTEGDADPDTAQRVVTWYERRWTIEEYFKVLKSGTRVEDRRLDHADDLRKCLAFDAITACHVFDLQRMARDKPDTPADRVVDSDAITALYVRLMAYGIVPARPPPGQPPDIRTFVIDTARLAGFDPRKRQPLPGTQLLWKGYVYLQHATLTYRALKDADMIKH